MINTMAIFKHLLIIVVILVIGLFIWAGSHQNTEISEAVLSNDNSEPHSSTNKPTTILLNYEILPDDFSCLIDLQDFEFTINQPPCISQEQGNQVTYDSSDSNSEASSRLSSEKPLFLILIHSAPVNLQQRMIIRNTWGSWTTQIFRIMFLIGAVESADLQKSLEMENEGFKDLIQGNFLDTYRNLTYKHAMALKWYIYYCPEAEYLMKTDDDIFVNTPFAVDYLNGLDGKSDMLICQVFYNIKAQRGIGKWRVTKQEYPETFYPDYCTGFMIIYSRNIAIRLYNETQRATYFWIDDVQITGILRQRANITLTNIESLLLMETDCNAIRKEKPDIRKMLFSKHNMDGERMDCAWKPIQLTLNNTR